MTAALTPTERAAQFKFTFPETDSAYVILDALDKGSFVKIIPSENKIIGYTKNYARGDLKNFKNHFVLIFDRPFHLKKTFITIH